MEPETPRANTIGIERATSRRKLRTTAAIKGPAPRLDTEEGDRGQVQLRRDRGHHVAEEDADQHVDDGDEHEQGDRDVGYRLQPASDGAQATRVRRLAWA